MLHSDIVPEHECDGEFMNVSESRFRHEDLVLQVQNRVLFYEPDSTLRRSRNTLAYIIWGEAADLSVLAFPETNN